MNTAGVGVIGICPGCSELMASAASSARTISWHCVRPCRMQDCRLCQTPLLKITIGASGSKPQDISQDISALQSDKNARYKGQDALLER